MKYTKLFSVALLTAGMLLPQVGQAYASTSSPICQTDSVLSAFARQRVNSAASAVRGNLKFTQVTNAADSIKKKIDATSLKTGGKLRDIYVGGAQSNDKQGMVEEYLLHQFGPLDTQLNNQLEQSAQNLLNQLEANLNQVAAAKANSRGNASASTSVSSVQTSNVRYGSFKLQQRGPFGLMRDVGRFSYTVTARTTASVNNIHFNEQYKNCANQPFEGEYGYGAKVTITPVLEVRYQFNHLGGSASNRYHTFSGSFKIMDSNQRIEQVLAVDNPNL